MMSPLLVAVAVGAAVAVAAAGARAQVPTPPFAPPSPPAPPMPRVPKIFEAANSVLNLTVGRQPSNVFSGMFYHDETQNVTMFKSALFTTTFATLGAKQCFDIVGSQYCPGRFTGVRMFQFVQYNDTSSGRPQHACAYETPLSLDDMPAWSFDIRFGGRFLGSRTIDGVDLLVYQQWSFARGYELLTRLFLHAATSSVRRAEFHYRPRHGTPPVVATYTMPQFRKLPAARADAWKGIKGCELRQRTVAPPSPPSPPSRLPTPRPTSSQPWPSPPTAPTWSPPTATPRPTPSWSPSAPTQPTPFPTPSWSPVSL